MCIRCVCDMYTTCLRTAAKLMTENKRIKVNSFDPVLKTSWEMFPPQRRLNAGPSSKTIGQHWANVGYRILELSPVTGRQIGGKAGAGISSRRSEKHNNSISHIARYQTSCSSGNRHFSLRTCLSPSHSWYPGWCIMGDEQFTLSGNLVKCSL